MAGMLDKLKETFGKAKTKASEVANSESIDSIKGKAGDLADKVGEKMPDKVKETYGKVSDKVSEIIPGGDDDAPADTAAATTVDEMTTADPAPVTEPLVSGEMSGEEPGTDAPDEGEPIT
jgi:uncharacterized protein YjbJ (UPF0337 family)